MRFIRCFIIAVLFIAATVPLSVASSSPQQSPDPFDLYDGHIAFDVYRKGDLIGEHVVNFETVGSTTQVRSRFEIAIKLLFVTVFRYTYDSSGFWQDGILQSLEATVDDDGDVVTLKAQLSGDQYTIAGRDGEYRVSMPLFPTTHWHFGITGQDQVLNTLTGNLDQVVIARLGSEAVLTENGEIQADKYSYSGDLDVTVWYDEKRRWVKMQFPGKDGVMIDYICRKCQGG